LTFYPLIEKNFWKMELKFETRKITGERRIKKPQRLQNNDAPVQMKSLPLTFQISVQQIRGELHADDRRFSQKTLQDQRRDSSAWSSRYERKPSVSGDATIVFPDG